MKLPRLCLSTLFCLLLSYSLSAQDQPLVPEIIADLRSPDILNRTTTVTQDQDITRLLYLHAENQKNKPVTGCRILIFSETGASGRQRGQEIRSRFMSEFPGIEPYLSWDPPHYKVYVGDFRTRSEALRQLKSISGSYRSAIIVENTPINPR
jgi:hypothetical protein